MQKLNLKIHTETLSSAFGIYICLINISQNTFYATEYAQNQRNLFGFLTEFRHPGATPNLYRKNPGFSENLLELWANNII